MWQVVLAAAAAAGSGILAKKFIHPNESEKPISDANQNDIQSQDHEESNSKENKDGKIFRFSSAQKGNKDLKKKAWSGFKGIKKNGKKTSDSGGRVDQDQMGKKVSVCLKKKKRRTSKFASGKCDSCASKDNSFGWGVGVGIMYMTSAGKAEITRLKSTMEETGKVVQELKFEISRRKSLCNGDTEYEGEKDKKHIEIEGGSYGGSLFTKSKCKMPGFVPFIEERECGSSGVTEDQQPELVEMDRLEAELESELQKLPWCGGDGFGSQGRTNAFEAERLAIKRESDDELGPNLHQYNGGVLPTELDNKLCHVLIEQQESHIAKLEGELQRANSKLHEKEAELLALKNCVKRLSEFSLATPPSSDEENEDVKMGDGMETKMGFEFEPTKSTVGIKRSMGFDHPQECSLFYSG